MFENRIQIQPLNKEGLYMPYGNMGKSLISIEF